MDIIHAAGMDATLDTYVDDECFDTRDYDGTEHDTDGDTDDDTDCDRNSDTDGDTDDARRGTCILSKFLGRTFMYLRSAPDLIWWPEQRIRHSIKKTIFAMQNPCVDSKIWRLLFWPVPN